MGNELNLYTAIVKWFDNAKGYGFATVAHDNRDIFIHHNNINPEEEGYKTLSEGQEIELSFVQQGGRLKAVEVFT